MSADWALPVLAEYLPVLVEYLSCKYSTLPLNGTRYLLTLEDEGKEITVLAAYFKRTQWQLQLKGEGDKMVATCGTSERENENLQQWKRMFSLNKQVKEKKENLQQQSSSKVMIGKVNIANYMAKTHLSYQELLTWFMVKRGSGTR